MRAIVFFALFLSAFALFTPLRVSAQAATPAETVRAFYKWYVHALNKKDEGDPINDDKATARKYVTASLLAKIRKAEASEDGLDADYFLAGQDWDKDWEFDRNMTIASPTIAGATATIRMVLHGKEIDDHKLKIVLKKEAGLWKIDRVNDWNL